MRVLGERGIALTGVIEQSTILDYAPTLSGNDLYYMGMLPVYAATANYFKKAGVGVDQFEWFDKAWKFVDEKYGRALIASDSITPEEERAIAEEMSELIGLSADFCQAKHLRIELDTFRKNIMADEGLFTGRYDTRFTEPAYMDVQGDNEFFAGEDPSGDAIMTPDESAWMMLVQETGFKGSPNNVLLSFKVNEDWNWTHQAPGTMGSPVCPNTAYDMGTALRRNPYCRVLFFGGIHDAATPFWNVKHSISKMFLPKSITDRIEYHVHENGHMAYEDQPTLEKMAPELAAFYDKRHQN
ncbi:MAG: peptidase S10, partial [Eggerthellaceae bacterium]|nr:peptidase S10 [Eggerthellaceae bacterium]